ncbi:hypothetical protein [Alicycliphilus denitrificans]|uniref:hypothetical protein n=1 Tax=Alicycliphilus denitrificans TaxID=179636 RepID=UPI00384C892D
MIFIKTEAGQQLLRERQGVLSLRQRSAFLLFDGERTLQQVLALTETMGITGGDVQLMVDAGLLEHTRPAPQTRSPKVPATADLAEQ